ncbi:MAG: hypothetical protein ACREJD_15990 [Phycisphaerales bacterium]
MHGPGEFIAAIEHPAMCLRCGYELQGLSSYGVCPECGFSIAESLERRRLGLSAPAYLSTLRTGAVITIGALVFFVISGITRWNVMQPLFAPGTQKLFAGLDGVASALLMAGVWMLTIDDPGLHEMDQARPNKRAMRAAAAFLLLFALASFAFALNLGLSLPRITATPTTASLSLLAVVIGSALADFACWLTLATGLTNYTRWLAVRVPDRRLLGMAKTMSWMIPCALVLALGASIVFGTATRILPLTLMALLIGAARERLKPDASR